MITDIFFFIYSEKSDTKSYLPLTMFLRNHLTFKINQVFKLVAIDSWKIDGTNAV